MSNATSASPSAIPWTHEMLDAARQQGDEVADALAQLIFRQGSGLAPTGSRLGYNQLVDLADALATDAELFLVHGSHLSACFQQFPEELRAYYEPMPAPAWVEPDKLRIAAQLWRDNSLALLGLLYAASLPACYLIANGIPALYDTEKLREQKYIFQRIYETGLMLDAVMDPDGLRLLEDVPPDDPDHAHLATALNALDPAGQWRPRDGKVVRTAAGQAGAPALDPAAVAGKLRAVQSSQGTGKYLWGRGYIAAKKVRLLHASMRYMLLHPPSVAAQAQAGPAATLSERLRQRREPWPVQRVGQPVNQEDLAYTLLTFAYLLPKGLERWGCRVSREQKESFLHLWRVVGHVMGLRDDLMTDRWEQAEQLFALILQRQGRGSPAGVALTEAVAQFLKSYLPTFGGLRDHLPYTLIADQLGAQAQELLEPASWRHVTDLYGRFLKRGTRAGLFLFYRLYAVVDRGRLSDAVFGTLVHRTSEELIASWRDEYQRNPFYVPTDLTTWELKRGVDAGFQARLTAWRERIFVGVLAAVVLIGTGLALLAVGAVLAAFWKWTPAIVVAAGGVLALLAAVWQMARALPARFAQRPRLGAAPLRRRSRPSAR